MADINLSIDGQQFTAPAWATEQTLQQMLEAIQKLEGVSTKQKGSMENLVKEINRIGNEEGKDNDELIKAINEIKDGKGKGTLLGESGKSVGMFQSALKTGVGIFGIFLTAVSAAAIGLKAIGNQLRDSRGGTSLDLGTGDAFDDAANFRASMQSLGFTSAQLNERFEDASSIIAVVGRRDFLQLTKSIQDITGAGSDFGITLAQMSEALDSDLKLRQQIGLLNMLDGQKQAKRSAELYEMQLKATAILGKSIDEIAGSADDTLTTNASIQLLLQSMGPEANGFVTAIQSMASEMSASGLSQGVNNAIQNAMLESVAFRTDAGGELFEALTALDAQAGTDLRAKIQQINELSKTNPEAAALMMNEFGSTLVNAAKGLTDEQLAEIRPVIENFGDLGKQLSLSIGQLRQSGQAAEDINQLAKASATLDNALAKFRGSLAGTSNNLLASFGTPLTQFLSAFTEGTKTLDGRVLTEEELKNLNEEELARVEESESIFQVLNAQAEKIALAFSGLFGLTEDGTGSMKNLAESIKKKVNPFIENMGDKVAGWVQNWEASDVTGFIDTVAVAFGAIAGVAGAVAKVFGFIANIIVDTDTVEGPDGEPIEQFDLSGTIINALLVAFAYKAVKSAAGALFSKGMESAMSFASSKMPGFGGSKIDNKMPSGKGAAKTGAGFGAGAVGMAAFGVAAAGVGVALLGLETAITSFAEMEWKEFGKGLLMVAIPLGIFGAVLAVTGAAATVVAPGLAAIGVALAGIGIAAAGIGYAAQAIGSLFGNSVEEDIALQDATTKNIKELGDVSEAELKSTAAGIEAISDAMKSFANATDEGWFSGPDISDQYAQLDVFEKFSKLDGAGLHAFTSEMNILIDTIDRLNAIETAEIIASADALKKLNDATSKGFGERLMDTVDKVIDTIAPGDAPTPSPTSIMPMSADGTTSSDPTMQVLAINTKIESHLGNISTNTKKTVSAVDKLSSESGLS